MRFKLNKFEHAWRGRAAGCVLYGEEAEDGTLYGPPSEQADRQRQLKSLLSRLRFGGGGGKNE